MGKNRLIFKLDYAESFNVNLSMFNIFSDPFLNFF